MRVFCNRLAHTQAQPVEPYRLLKLVLALLLAALRLWRALSLSLCLHIPSEKKKKKVLTSWSYRSFINEEALGINRSTCSFGVLRETHS